MPRNQIERPVETIIERFPLLDPDRSGSISQADVRYIRQNTPAVNPNIAQWLESNMGEARNLRRGQLQKARDALQETGVDVDGDGDVDIFDVDRLSRMSEADGDRFDAAAQLLAANIGDIGPGTSPSSLVPFSGGQGRGSDSRDVAGTGGSGGGIGLGLLAVAAVAAAVVLGGG